MREVLSLSLPGKTVKAIKKTAKERGFKSVSQYIKNLFAEDVENIISEKELIKIIKEGRREYREGKTIKANSIEDLL